MNTRSHTGVPRGGVQGEGDHASGPRDGGGAAPARSSAWSTFRAIAWSFFGVRRRHDHEQASVRINPIHVIVAGLVGVFMLVIGLMVLVKWVAA